MNPVISCVKAPLWNIPPIVNGSIVMENGKIVSNQVGKPLDLKL